MSATGGSRNWSGRLQKPRRPAERAEVLVEIQKKVSQILGIALPTEDDEP
jgi:hypothetical protein